MTHNCGTATSRPPTPPVGPPSPLPLVPFPPTIVVEHHKPRHRYKPTSATAPISTIGSLRPPRCPGTSIGAARGRANGVAATGSSYGIVNTLRTGASINSRISSSSLMKENHVIGSDDVDNQKQMCWIHVIDDVLYRFRRYKMKVSVCRSWRITSGVSFTEIAQKVIGGTWLKYGTFESVACKKCCPQGEPPVDIQLLSLPDAVVRESVASSLTDDLIFELSTRCTSSREHLRSQVILLVSGISNLPPVTSKPLSLRARCHVPLLSTISQPAATTKTTTTTTPTNHSLVPAIRHAPTTIVVPRTSSRALAFVDYTNKYLHLPSPFFEGITRTVYFGKELAVKSGLYIDHLNLQTCVDSRCVSQLPEATVAGIPERFSWRPTVIVVFMEISSENFDKLRTTFADAGFPFQSFQLAVNIFGFTSAHASVECLVQALTNLKPFLVNTNNPFRMDLTMPNSIFRFIGWSSNLIRGSTTTKFLASSSSSTNHAV
ncbi:hypothetical protein Pelo_7243 [Pelomyxa schiedti]|nr:hypothetical protein Pelo_7243 [Pelomyxa schiedti]